MSWWDVIPVVGDIIGGKLAANATRDSAKIQAESAQRALDLGFLSAVLAAKTPALLSKTLI